MYCPLQAEEAQVPCLGKPSAAAIAGYPLVNGAAMICSAYHGASLSWAAVSPAVLLDNILDMLCISN